ncbi:MULTISPECIES: M30 family zinc metallopeptidase [Cupriavidus]|nr:MULTISPECIES: hemagglutinin [Cupriavidus]KAB0599734.1 hemagglutinin [Cupriavidus pauculus]KAI3591802.1 putative hemagglutinin-related transmembrane protein [Cupriavidus sp. U2]UAL03735.1 hemagglutinin [Cupriavidus pauculus]
MRNQRTLSFPGSLALALLTSAVLAACGGGGDGGDASTQATTTTTATTSPGAAATPTDPAAKPASVVSPACSNCAAVDANTYAGSGIGVWQNINATAAAVDMPINIAGLTGQDVTLVFTNQSGTAQTMPTIPLTASHFPTVAASAIAWDDGTSAVKRRISDFNHDGWAAKAGARGAAPSNSTFGTAPLRAAAYVPGDTRTFYHEDNTPRAVTLIRTDLASDGTTVNFWVESTESGTGKVTSAIVNALYAGFVPSGKIYDMLKQTGGPVWGPHVYSDLISGAVAQPIDIVILNFDNNATPFGMVGYFYGRNALTAAADPLSNQSVSLYLDSETLYLGGASGMKSMLLTMAHEGMHMQNFYRRGVVKGPTYAFDTWLEEASAMMMEDFASQSIDSTYNAIRDVRFPNYIDYKAGSYNCSLLTWDPFGAACDSYSVSGSLGGFLDRQLGLSFYKNLLTNVSSTDSVTVLDSSIRATVPTTSLGEQLRRFAATSGALMKAPSPTGFGFPARAEGGFTLPVIDPQALLASRTLTQSVPSTLQPYASLPVVRKAVNGTYSETVKVPPNSTLSVVIQ